jgi:Fe-S cluster assembly ATP-binding protein
MKEALLKINNLTACIGDKKIINNFNLEVKENETHVIMGPNGSGKSTLSKILAGHPFYEVINGTITLGQKDLLKLAPETRSHEGLFLAFQAPVEISGVTNYDFLRIAYNERCKYRNEPELDPLEFMQLVQSILNKLKIKEEFLSRNLNEGFSGGEKKRNEILQLLLLKPKLIILDEIDSGLDIDALKIICDALKENLPKGSSLIVITHYSRLLKYIKPSHIHIMIGGKIIQTGNIKLIKELEKFGYEYFIDK